MLKDFSFYNIRSNNNKTKLNNNEFVLKSNDYVSIRSEPNSDMQKVVEILGAIKYPGNYILKNSDEKISDLIIRAGGLKENSYPKASRFTRNKKMIKIDLEKILKNPNSNIDIKLHSNDQILVATEPNIIQIIGEVSSPGYYKFNQNLRVSDYLKISGGFSQKAEKNDVFVVYPNGESRDWKRYIKNPKVYDGSIIQVGQKKEEEPFDKTEYAKELTSILANLAQAISLLILAKS